jgi:hypothetical protein
MTSGPKSVPDKGSVKCPGPGCYRGEDGEASLEREADVPEPIFVAIAASLAGKTIASLYDLVRKKFAGKAEATAALEAAQGAEPDSAEVRALSDELANAARSDPGFALELRALWQKVSVEQHADRGAVTNQVTGNISGNVVQARDIHGGVTF